MTIESPLNRTQRNKLNDALTNIEDAAKKAKAIAESLINESFDDAELKTEIEQKLLNLETQYAPKLTEVTTQLAQVDNKSNEKMLTVLNIETFDGSNEAYHPSCLYIPNGWNGYKYWLAYTPLPYQRTPYTDRWECPCIAASNDLINWILPKGAPNPLHDLTQTQIDKMDYFSDTSITLNGDTLEVWYRHTNGDNTSNTNIYRVTTTDGVNWSPPEMVQDSQNTSVVVSPVANQNFMRSQSVIIEDGQYVAYYPTNEGMYKVTSSSPSTKVWTNLTKLNLTGGNNITPWHASVVKENGTYHLIGYFNTGGLPRIEYYKSTDGVNFTFVKEIIKVDNENYINLKGLYQSCAVKTESDWAIIASANVAAYPRIERRGLFLMRGKSLENVTVVDTPTVKHRSVIHGGLLLQNSNKPNAPLNPIVFNINEQGEMLHGLALRAENGRLVPSYYHPNGVSNITNVILASTPPNNLPFMQIGQIGINSNEPDAFYLSTANNKWIKFSTEALIKTGRINLDLSSTLNITNRIYRVVVNTRNSGLINIDRIMGGVEGQEIILLNALSTVTDEITLNHSLSSDGGRIRLPNGEPKIIKVNETVKLHNINGNWYLV